MTAPNAPSVQELWEQAQRKHPLTDNDRTDGRSLTPAQSDCFRDLMRQHGKALPPEPSLDTAQEFRCG